MNTPQSRFYLGVDPSLTSAGIAIVGPSYCETYVVQPKKIQGGTRLKYHVDRLREIVRNQGRISTACIEGPSFNSVNRADDMGQIRGTYLYALEDLDIETIVVPPTSLKKFATGIGTASKDLMTAAARKEWPSTTFQTDDAVDAAWLAALARALREDILVTPSQLGVIRGIRDLKSKYHFRFDRKTNL